MAIGEESDSSSINFFFHEQVKSVQKWLQTVYFCCVIAALGAMTYQCTTLFTDMRNEPITTYIDTHNPVRRFPTVSLCPSHFKYNLRKLLAVTEKNRTNSGIYNDDLTSTTARTSVVASRVMQYFTSYESMNYMKGSMSAPALTQAQWRLFREHIWNTVIGDNQTYEGTELYLTHDFDDVVQEVPGSPIINKRKFMSVLGACYAFDFNISIPPMAGQLAKVEFSVPRIAANTKYDYRPESGYFIENSDKITLGEPSYWPQNPELFVYQTRKEEKDITNDPNVYEFQEMKGYNTMRTLTEYRINYYVTSVSFNRLNLRRRPCRDWSEQDRSICMVQCFNDEFCSKMTDPCLIFHPNQTHEEQRRQLCSWVEGALFFLEGVTKHCLSRPEVWNGGPYDLLCSQRCPIRCFETIHYFTREAVWKNRVAVGNYEDTNKLMGNTTFWANVTLRLQDSQRQLKLYEHLVWSTDTLAAALASAGSLWTGLSGLAVMGIISSVSIEFRKRQRREKTVA